ncbi:teneurin-m-like isoform X2 [Macrobrachium rosenbergii]|uniref:teneurin-m-like isoform X2 n=1 Tax=Macrobrachium rosenbergii TaxID=79674 RepID=UPI0034D4DB1D
MSRLNGRVHHSGPQHGTSAQYQAVPTQYHQGPPVQYQGSQPHPEEFEPSCLVRTPSGNVYIPSDMPKPSTLEYKSSLHSPSLHSPVKGDQQKVMEGYNVQFGGGLPAPVLPVRNNLRRPGHGNRGVGTASSSVGRGQGSPRCSWKCTAIIFITIAVVLAAVLIYIAATSSLAWSHGGCAVLVEDPAVISDEAHPGQAKSRGNHQGRGRHDHSPPTLHDDGFLFLYNAIQEQRPYQYLLEQPIAELSPRRMRRSVQHDLDPPRMDTDPPLQHSPPPPPPPPNPQFNSPTYPASLSPSNPVTVSLPSTLPANTESSKSDGATPPNALPLHDEETSESTSSTQDGVASAPSEHPPLLPSEGAHADPELASPSADTPSTASPKIVILDHVPLDKVSFLPDKIPDGAPAPKDEYSAKVIQSNVREVYAPVIDVVEYSEGEESLVSDAVVSISLTDDYTKDTDVVNQIDEYSDIAKNGDEESEPVTEPDYMYGNKPNESHADLVEYEQENSTQVQLSTDIPDIINGESNVTLEDLSMYWTDFDPDIMVGDDPRAASGTQRDKAKRQSKPLRSWMGAFPTLPPRPKPDASNSSKILSFSSSVSRKLDTDSIIYPPSEITSPSLGAQKTGTLRFSLTQDGQINKRKNISSSINAWFSRYGYENSNYTRDDETPLVTEISVEEEKQSLNQSSADAYDPKYILGESLSLDPEQYPSRILRSLGVPKYRDVERSPDYYDSEGSSRSRPRLAVEVFPHIFDYDLDDHDEYYYNDDEDNLYYFDDYSDKNSHARPSQGGGDDFEEVQDDGDDSDDVILSKSEDIGETEAGFRSPEVVTVQPVRRLHVVPTNLVQSITHYPSGLRAMSLMKEDFQLDISEPQVKLLPKGQDEVVEIEVVQLDSKSWPHRSVETGPDYSPASQHHDREITPTVKKHIETTSTEATTPASTPVPHHVTPSKPPAVPSAHLYTAKFLPTRSPPLEPRPVRVSDFDSSAQQRAFEHSSFLSIPKFLMQKTESTPPYQRSHVSDHYAGTTVIDREPRVHALNTYASTVGEEIHGSSTAESRNLRSVHQSDRHHVTYHEPVSSLTYSSHSTEPWSEDREHYEEKLKEREELNHNNPSLASSYNPEEIEKLGKEMGTIVEDSSVSHRQNPFLPSTQRQVQSVARKSKSVTVNVTISTDDDAQSNPGSEGKSKPLYILSVSVPTTGKDQDADISIVKPDDQQHIARLSLTVLGNQTYSDTINSHKDPSTDFAGATASRLVSQSPSSSTGQCNCPCPCQTSSAPSNTHSIPIPQSFLPESRPGNRISDYSSYASPPVASADTDSDKSSTDSSPKNCKVGPDPPSTTPTPTIPPLSPEVERELEEHKLRPQKTIPPDGTTFKMMELGERLRQEIPPYGYWNMQFYQTESAYVKFDVSIPRGSSIGIYGRRNALPTHTSYDFLQVLNGYKTSSGRTTRSPKAPSQPQTLTKYLEQGHWFLSLYNDDGDPQEVSLTGDVSTEYTEGCPKGCSGNGDCILGSCQCHPGFAGPDCTQMMCPVLCSGNGEYRDGECTCRPGWKGRECSIRHDECEVPDCNGHGHCVDGRCHCAKGFKGEFCEETDCPHPTCSGHGWCVGGHCVCKKGWRGPDCGSTDELALHCLPDCSGHGQFDLESHECVCEPEWTGSECDVAVCGLDCGAHGRCEDGSCLCFPGWTGERCDLLTCDPRCEEHGQCKNGTCICMTGWNGRHCTLAGCPNSCSGNGACVIENEEWVCRCQAQWEGHDCSVMLETNCADNKDNDLDGLVDCADAECCSTPACQQSTLCLTSVDPIDILLRKQPPAVTASFFQRMRFIVEEGSVQNYAKGPAFNQSRASVVRGRVISGRGTGLRGVRVSHYRSADMGFTLTRPGGWFDLMVNGGGAVKLLFGKSPFLPVTETVWVPWNEIVVIDTVVMTTVEVVPPPQPTPCPDHSYDALKPVVLATWKHGFQGGCPECSAILTESQVVQESLSIPGTGLHLVYHSSRALGYESTIQLQLTPSVIPETLRRIYLRITIEGILFEKTFEADPDIKFTYAWNRLNVYRQRVYGATWAVVKVGFAYINCDQIIWDAQTTQVSGHDMSISDIGGWDLSIHHRYNFHEGILQKGDGRNMHLKQKPRVLRTLMGDGHQREVSCRSCDGPADKQRLLTPAALASGPDGSLYVADFNLIRRILPDNTVKTVVKLNETRVSYRYHLAVSPVSGEVYISDHESHLILKVRDPDDYSRPEENYMPFVGSGERCLPGDEVGCGDGSLARDAKLQYPKGMAVSLDEVLYFADGTNVRAVDSDGLINTVIGTHRHRTHWRPLPCEGTVPVTDVSLRWPTAVAVSPLDDSLYVLDDHHVLRLTKDGQVKVMAGRPLHCPPLGHDAPSDLAAHTTLRSPQSLAFAPTGDLYIAESDNERINRVRVIETDERIHDFAGADSKCNCQEETCPCYDESHVLAATAVFSTISALSVTPDGVVHVLDQGNLRIRSVTSSIPEHNDERMYEIYSPETQEVYIFNRFGHHALTRSIPTGRTIYTFAYNVNTSNGKLSTVTDAGGNRVSFLRDYTGQVTMVENSRQQKCRLQMSRTRRLEELVTPDEHNVTLTYHGATGLLRSRMDSTGRAHVYTYDKYGRLTRCVTPSGQVVDLAFDLSQKGARVTLTRDGTAPVTMLIKGALVTETVGTASRVTAQLPDGSVISRTAWGHHIATETVPYTLLQDHTLAHSYPVSGRQRTEIGDELVNSFDWKYFVETSERHGPVTQVGRKMRVNGEDLLTFKYDLYTGTEAVLNEAGATLLNVSYDALGRPLRWSPAQPFLPVQLTYDRFGQLEHWSWGEMREDYAYDRNGRFEGVTFADGTKVTYSFKDLSSVKPYKVSIASGAEHLLEYDEGGAMSSITTPRGHKYSFHVQPSLLHNRFTFTPPGSPRHPYQLFYSDDGRILAEVAPHQASRVVYHYDHTGRLHLQIYGDGSIEYGYHPETGLIRSVAVREQEFELRTDNKYHAGLVKEQRIRFGPGTGVDSAKLRFLYDGNARPRRVEMEINGKEQPDYDMKYNMILGTLDSVGDLKVTSSYHNKTVVQDVRKTMLRVTGFDPHGRIVESELTLRGRLVRRSRYGYDKRGRLATMSTWRGPGSSEVRTNYTYTPDGFLQAVDGEESWQFRYDANGNMISVVEGGREMTATYDGADRLVGWGDVELNTYSPAGTVVRQGEVHLSYSARGNVKSAWQQGQYKIWSRHDHRGRLSVWEDDHGNITQFFYADLRRPNLPTHIHYPKRGVTHALEYDERGHLMSLHTGKRQLWVSTDHLGSPVAVFDDSGVLVKEIVRSPWGATLSDSRPDLLLHVDFQGALRDPVTGFLVFGLHSYDPVHAQWMAPRYDLVISSPDHVGAIYTHRFHDNDPINPVSHQPKHYTDLDSWLKLYGVDMTKMLGSSYHDETVEQPVGALAAPQLAPALNVISGLSCSTEGVLKQFAQPTLLPKSLVRSAAPAWAIPGWAALGRFSSSPPVLGPGVLVSRVNGRALVTLVPSRENPVVQDVARDVLNGSALLDITFTHHHHHTLYLVKENADSRHDDLQQLQRLSGRFNVTSKEEGEHHEVKVVDSDVSLVILYGIDPPAARHRLLRHAHRRAVERAWEMERLLAERGSPTKHQWTVEEREELVSEGFVTGYSAADHHSIHRFPLLADDPTNVVFRRDTGRRRRRSRMASHT